MTVTLDYAQLQYVLEALEQYAASLTAEARNDYAERVTDCYDHVLLSALAARRETARA